MKRHFYCSVTSLSFNCNLVVKCIVLSIHPHSIQYCNKFLFPNNIILCGAYNFTFYCNRHTNLDNYYLL